MSKAADISEGTTLKEMPPFNMVRLREVTSPKVRCFSDFNLCEGKDKVFHPTLVKLWKLLLNFQRLKSHPNSTFLGSSSIHLQNAE